MNYDANEMFSFDEKVRMDVYFEVCNIFKELICKYLKTGSAFKSIFQPETLDALRYASTFWSKTSILIAISKSAFRVHETNSQDITCYGTMALNTYTVGEKATIRDYMKRIYDYKIDSFNKTLRAKLYQIDDDTLAGQNDEMRAIWREWACPCHL
jgi:hypothetical protein